MLHVPAFWDRMDATQVPECDRPSVLQSVCLVIAVDVAEESSNGPPTAVGGPPNGCVGQNGF